MTIRVHHRESDYEYYSRTDLRDCDPIYVMPLYVIAAKHLKAMEEEWRAYISENSTSVPEMNAGGTAYPAQVLIEMDGDPIGFVGVVDDIFQFVPMHQKRVGEEDRA